MLERMRYITDPTEASQCIAQLMAEPVIGVDIETMPLPQYADHKQAGGEP